MEVIPFPTKSKKTGRPKGSVNLNTRLQRINLEAEIAQTEHELIINRRKAIRAGLARDVIANGLYTAKCRELNEKLFKLQCSVNPSISELKDTGI